jgi:drug/metabolite transporter (DMT)-like permease
MREQGWRIALLGAVGMGSSQLSMHWALDYASVVQVATMVTTMPIFTVLADRLINNARMTLPKIISGFGAFGGVVFLLTDGYVAQLAGDSQAILGILLALVTAITGAVYIVLMKPLVNQYGAIRVTALTMVFVAIALWVVVGFAWGVWVDPLTLFDRPARQYGSILTLGIWNTTIGFVVWLAGLAAVSDTARANYLFFLKPVIAAGLAILILGQTVTVIQVLAIFAICACVLVEVFYDQFRAWYVRTRKKGPVSLS